MLTLISVPWYARSVSVSARSLELRVVFRVAGWFPGQLEIGVAGSWQDGGIGFGLA